MDNRENRIVWQVRVKDFRKNRALTQEELAQELGISRQSIIALENGRFLPSLPLALSIAELFDTPLEEIFLCADPQLLRRTAQALDQALDRALSNVQRALPSPVSLPKVNIMLGEKELVLEVGLAGYNEKEVELEVSANQVVLKAATSANQASYQYLVQELTTGPWQRAIDLPVEIKPKQTVASFKNGLLTVKMPLAQTDKGAYQMTKIKIS